ncbi:MAG: glycosyltransferase family 39 protein [Elusimicrobiota bacterium]
MDNNVKVKKFLIAVFIAAVVIRLVYLFGFTDIYSWQGDDRIYHEYAQSILSGEWVSTTKYFDRMPFYPIFLAAVYFLFGQSVLIAKIVQIVLFGGTTCIMIYFLGMRVFNQRIGICAAVYSIIYYGLIRMGGYLYTETLYTFLLGSAAYLLYMSYMSGFNNKRYMVSSGVLIALTTLTRPLTVILPVLIVFWLIILRKGTFIENVKRFLWILIPMLLLYTPWVMRNYYVYRAFVPTMIETGYAFYSYNVAIPGREMGIEKENKEQEYTEDLIKTDKKYLEYAMNFLKRQKPKYFIKLIIVKFGLLLYPFLPNYDITFGYIFPFFMYGIYGVFKEKKTGSYILLLVVCNLLIQTALFSGLPRFRAPMAPIYIIFAFYGLDKLYKKINIRTFSLGAGCWGLINIMFLFFSSHIRAFVRIFWSL